eukprot:2892913-Amphidinium_carterae.1
MTFGHAMRPFEWNRLDVMHALRAVGSLPGSELSHVNAWKSCTAIKVVEIHCVPFKPRDCIIIATGIIGRSSFALFCIEGEAHRFELERCCYEGLTHLAGQAFLPNATKMTYVLQMTDV